VDRRHGEPKVDAVAQAQSALEHMGFKATRARALVEAALAAGALDAAALLHEALRLS
jgi:Holliday junction resolvasome RuvABC DNA-binding subunit